MSDKTYQINETDARRAIGCIEFTDSEGCASKSQMDLAKRLRDHFGLDGYIEDTDE